MAKVRCWIGVLLGIVATVASTGCTRTDGPVLTFSGSVVGCEADVIGRQLARFGRDRASITVALRATPDAADQRHQRDVQWLNARATDPDVVQPDVIWTPKFAAAGRIANLERFHPPVDRLFSAAIAADRWNGGFYALPWFVDVGMLYWRTDLMPRSPRDIDELGQLANRARDEHGVPFGFVWQSARYEGLVTVLLEYAGAFGAAILDDRGRVVVDSEEADKVSTYMRDSVYVDGVVPPAVLTWREEPTRFAFQTGQAAFMRNWPYAYALLQVGSQSSVAGRFAVTSMPPGPKGRPTAALGGSALAVNAYSDQPDAAYELIDHLLQPEPMIERARVVGQYPTRPAR